MQNTNLADLTAQPRPFVVDGRTYQIYPIRVIDVGQLQAWCDAQAPNPYISVSEQLGKGIFTPAQEKHLLEAAIKIASAPKPKIGSPECDELLNTDEGVIKICHLLIRRGDPSFTESDADALLRSLDIARLQELSELLGTRSIFSSCNAGTESDPKASTGGGSITPS